MPSTVPLIPIDLDRRRHLRFRRRAVFAVETALAQQRGASRTCYAALFGLVQAIVDSNIYGINLTDVSILLWQGLLHEDPTLTLEAVQEMMPIMEPVKVAAIGGSILEAWNAATPAQEPGGNGEATSDPLAPSPGASSGPSSAFALA